jgi:mono/diheme cytochrome c family protein
LKRQTLENRLPNPEQTHIHQIGMKILVVLVLMFLGLGCWFFWGPSNPYIKNVLSLHGDRVLGHAIFQMNCSGCHGLEAQGRVGPNLHEVSKRKSPKGLIKQVISGDTPPMPQFQPSPQEMADLLSYLETL